jgi:hypothetical protein
MDEDLLALNVVRLREELTRTRDAIREHRDQRGHDRCQRDDQRLYLVLPEGRPGDLRLPATEDEFLTGCRRFYRFRRADQALPEESLPGYTQAREAQALLAPVVANLERVQVPAVEVQVPIIRHVLGLLEGFAVPCYPEPLSGERVRAARRVLGEMAVLRDQGFPLRALDLLDQVWAWLSPDESEGVG